MVTSADLVRKYENDVQDAIRSVDSARAEVRAILDAARAEGRGNLTAQETARSEILFAKIERFDSERKRAESALAVARREQADDAEYVTRSRQTRAYGSSPGGDSTQPALNGSVVTRDGTGNRPQWVRDDGRPGAVARGERFTDHEVTREQIKRARDRDNAIIGQYGDLGMQMRALTTSTGSAIVPTVWASEVIDRARNYAAVMKAGAQTVPMDAKIVQIGRLTADPAAGFRTEGSTITASDPTFDNVTLTAKTLNALVVGSVEFWQDASNAGDLVTEAMAKALAVQIDLAALFGGVTTGAETTATGNNMLPLAAGLPNPPNPTGILANLLANATTSVLGSATNGTVQTAATFYGEVLDTLYTPRDFNESPNAMLWPSHLARAYAKAADTTNQPMRQPPDVDAIDKYVTNQIPSGFTQGTGTLMSDLFIGDFTQLLVGQRLDLTVKVLDQRYAELGQTAVLCSWRGDVQVARPRAFAVYRYLKGV
jgi:HK97 family phage major capsid protein